MPTLWKINGTDVRDLGISGLRRTLMNLGADKVTFQTAQQIDAATLSGLALGDTAVITRTDDEVETTWFRGRVTRVPRTGIGAKEEMHYELTGPWWYLQNLVYQQGYAVVDGTLVKRAAAVIGVLPASSGGDVPVIVKPRATNIEVLQDVLDFCIAAGAPFDYDTLPTGYLHPKIGLRAPTCAEAVRTALKWMPDAAVRWDYSGTEPVLSLARRSTATGIDLDLSAGYLQQLAITPRPDLKVDVCVVQFVRNGEAGPVVAEVKDPPEATGLEFGAVVVVTPIQEAGEWEEMDDIAENFRGALSALQYEGQLVLDAERYTGALRPGDCINITNGLAAWATMKTQVQQVVDDVDAGTTTVAFGPPAHLSVQDLIGYVRDLTQGDTERDGVDDDGGVIWITPPNLPDTGTGGGSGAPAWRVFQSTLTLGSGMVVPDQDTLIAAIESVDFGDDGPVVGDVINLLVSGKVKFRATLVQTNPGDLTSLWAMELDLVEGETWYAMVHQTGLY